jgi:hypothetical protein
MQEIKVGIRIDPEKGISFFGIDEVNDLIRSGVSVTSIEPGGAVLRNLGTTEDGNERMALAGCDLKVVINGE